MSNNNVPGSNQNVNVQVRALTIDPAVTVKYKTKILHKNVVNGVNTLTQAMMNETNTKYVIKYDYMLGENITIPANCVLEFDGGSINGEHTLTGANTGINAGLVKIFGTDITLTGSWNILVFHSAWIDNVGATINKFIGNCCEIGLNFYFDKGIYNFSESICIYGDIRLFGDKDTILNFSSSDNTDRASIICGAKYVAAPFEDSIPWNGIISNLNIYVLSGKWQIIIGMFNAHDCVVENCYINTESHNIVTVRKAISVNNNANFANVTCIKENIIIRNNKIICDDENLYHETNHDDVAFECIGVGDGVYNVTIENNYIRATRDDLGIHMVENCVIKNNFINSSGGRIYASDSDNVLIDGNTIIVNEGCSCMGIYPTLECNYRLPNNIKIVNNTVFYKRTEDIYYGIRINAGKNIIVANNNTNGLLQINNDYIIENDTHHINPTRVEATPRNVIVTGNRLKMLHIYFYYENADARKISDGLVSDNIVDIFSVDTVLYNYKNNKISSDLDFNVPYSYYDGYIDFKVDFSQTTVSDWVSFKDALFSNDIANNIPNGKIILTAYNVKLTNVNEPYVAGLLTVNSTDINEIINDGYHKFGDNRGYAITKGIDTVSFKYLSTGSLTGTAAIRVYYIMA